MSSAAGIGKPPGKLRIIAGSRKGHRLKVAPGGELRPTSERVREAIFDALGPVDDLRVLDLFAGTGAMGLEALSRGAAHCVFVESNAAVADTLRANVGALGFESRSEVLVADYVTATCRLMGTLGLFDLLFVDPPYRMLQEVEARLEPLLPGLLGEDGAIVVEGPKSAGSAFSRIPVFDRMYGDTRVLMISMRRQME
ncbi:MAG: 16S rRNA (guanine(966)-N(2))-methyltransferase RsmD [Actinobacteria bacterium]|nr:16S rRNA (guanine(966)-N(2))-methyltransferase RsmD [Actinomycetota bacterium]